MNYMHVIYFTAAILTAFLLSYIPKYNRSRHFKRLVTKVAKAGLDRYHIKIEYPPEISSLPTNFIAIANHVSAIDALILLLIFPELYVLLDPKHFQIPLLGRLMKFVNMIPVERLSHHSRIETFETLINHALKGHSILIFPQGTTSDKIENFHSSAFVVAKKAYIPILPIFISFEPLHAFFLRPGEPISTSLKRIDKAKTRKVTIRIFSPITSQAHIMPDELRDTTLVLYQKWYDEYQLKLLEEKVNA